MKKRLSLFYQYVNESETSSLAQTDRPKKTDFFPCTRKYMSCKNVRIVLLYIIEPILHPQTSQIISKQPQYVDYSFKQVTNVIKGRQPMLKDTFRFKRFKTLLLAVIILKMYANAVLTLIRRKRLGNMKVFFKT